MSSFLFHPWCRKFCQGGSGGGEFEVHSGPAVLRGCSVARLARDGRGCFQDRDGKRLHCISGRILRRASSAAAGSDGELAAYELLYTTQLGEVRWRLPSGKRDFDLRNWFESAKLRWCEHTAERLALRTGFDGCPILDLPGERRPTIVRGTDLWHEPAPPS